MSQETGKESPEKKGNDSQDTVESLKAKLAAAEAQKAELLKETMSRKEKLEKLESEKNKAEELRLAEQGNYKQLVDQYKPKAEKLEAWDAKLDKFLESEMKDIPEDKRNLIPNFQDKVERLEWLKNAKDAGFFGTKQVPASVQSKTNTSAAGLPEFVSWSADDPRLTKLPTRDYKIWKENNRKPSSGVRGW